MDTKCSYKRKDIRFRFLGHFPLTIFWAHYSLLHHSNLYLECAFDPIVIGCDCEFSYQRSWFFFQALLFPPPRDVSIWFISVQWARYIYSCKHETSDLTYQFRPDVAMYLYIPQCLTLRWVHSRDGIFFYHQVFFFGSKY